MQTHCLAACRTERPARHFRLAAKFRLRAAGALFSAMRITALVAAFVLLSAQLRQAYAVGLIRDAETEALIDDYTMPIFRAAGLGGQRIHIHLVNSRAYNAFVVDGHNMFINVGAIIDSKTPNQLIGVIAHETGHIVGGHLSRLRQVVERAQSASLMFSLISLAAIAAGAAAGNAEVSKAGSAFMYGSQTALQRSFLAYRRIEESSADQAAVKYLNRTKQSPRGLLETFEHFAELARGVGYVNPYVQTHPIPTQRIAQLRSLAHESPYYANKDSSKLQLRHDMVRAKLIAFLDRGNPSAVYRKYSSSDHSLPARYARAIAAYYASGVDKAMPQINALIAAEPENPYFHELKGQFLLESGRARTAIAPLKKAVELAHHAGLIRIMLAQALLETGTRPHLQKAIKHLRKALVMEDKSAMGYRQLANAYGRLGRIGDAELASAQAYFYEGKLKLAKQQAERAKDRYPPHSASWVRADDIVNFKPPSTDD